MTMKQLVGCAAMALIACAGCGDDVVDGASVAEPAKPASYADEARQNVREIAEAAVAAYERDGQLCPASNAVPPLVSPITINGSYAWSTKPGEDFQGTGWMCLAWKPTLDT